MKTKLERAIDYVDAVELDSGQYAHYAEETSSWWIVDADDLAELADYLDDDPQISGDAYSHWCAGSAAKEMPDGWSPEASKRADDALMQVAQWVIIVGNPVDGTEIIGPFVDAEDANCYADDWLGRRDWWVVLVQKPADGGNP